MTLGGATARAEAPDAAPTPVVPAPASSTPPAPAPPTLAPASPVPSAPASHTERQYIPGLYITGPVVFGAFWVGSVAGFAAGNEPVGIIPVAGPFVAAAKCAGDKEGDGPCGGFLPVFYALGAMQAAGLVVTVLGLTIQRDVRVPGPSPNAATVTLVPTRGGAALVGRF
jgi:hypothetical protein